MTKRLFYLLLFSISAIQSYAQVQRTVLSHYLFPEFQLGTIQMKSGVMDKAMLNYNSLTEEMVFEVKGEKLAIAKDRVELVDTIFIGERKFIAINSKFVELIYHSQFDLYIEHLCSVTPPGKVSPFGGTSQTSSATSLSSFETSGVLYSLKLPDGYVIYPKVNYWLKRDGKLSRAMNMKQLEKLFAQKKEQIKEYLKTHNVKFDKPESIVQLVSNL